MKVSEKKTTKYVEQVFKKKKLSKARIEALTKAQSMRRARSHRAKEEKKASQTDSDIKHPIRPNSLVPTPIPKAITEFMSTMSQYIRKRRDELQSKTTVAHPTHCLCHHVFTVGSSALYRLLKGNYGLERAHSREYYKGAQNDGAYWERVVQEWGYVEVDCSYYDILDIYPQPTGLSYRYPWIVATPDFVVKVQHKGKEIYACLEVKSVTSENAFKRIASEHKMQVQTALEVFNLDIGLLVVLHVNHKTKELIDKRVVLVQRSVCFENSKQMISAYGLYLQKSINQIFGTDIDLNFIEDQLNLLTESEQKSFIWSEHMVSLPKYTQCYLLKDRRADKRLRLRKADGPEAVDEDNSAGGYAYLYGPNVYK